MDSIRELDVVKTLHDAVSTDGLAIPAGSEGTVTSVFTVPQPALEVEFRVPHKPTGTVWTMVKLAPEEFEVVRKNTSTLPGTDESSTEQGIKLLVDAQSDPGQPVHPFTIPAGIYGKLLLQHSNSNEGEYYIQFTLPTTSIYGYNWVYATLSPNDFQPADPELASKTQDIPVINIENC